MISHSEEKQELRARSLLFFHLNTLLHGARKLARMRLAIPMTLIYVLSVYLWCDCTLRCNGLLSGFPKVLTFLCFNFAAIIGITYLFGYTPRSFSYYQNLIRIDFANAVGEAPFLIKNEKLSNNSNRLTFQGKGFPLAVWENEKPSIESALNVSISAIKQGKDQRTIILEVLAGSCQLPTFLPFGLKELHPDPRIMVLGETLTSTKQINLSKSPHILLGGSTGSGKTVLLKCILGQAAARGYIIYIADYKGGVDFPKCWDCVASMATENDTLISILSNITDELDYRKMLLNGYDVPNIDTYNEKIAITQEPLRRILFACDEIAEPLDSTGKTKIEKEEIAVITSKISYIARQGRAFGIHLLLATQRPDANVLSGQIKNNIDARVCGKADNTLSIIILDCGAASDMIPKDSQGRFVDNENTVFQAYYFDDEAFFAELSNHKKP